MFFKSVSIGVGAGIAVAAIAVSSTPAHAFVYFTPIGSNLDGDAVRDITTSVGATQSFNLNIDFTGLSNVPSSLSFLVNWDADELGLSSFIPGLTTSLAGSGSSRTITVGGISSPGTGPSTVGTFNFDVLSGLKNDGLTDFSTSFDLNQIFGNLPVGTSAVISSVEVQPTAVPTPALLPGLIGLGVAALRRKSEESTEENA